MGIEQNPKTKSRWALMARSGKKVMQFIQDGRYVAVVADTESNFVRQVASNPRRGSSANVGKHVFHLLDKLGGGKWLGEDFKSLKS
jgi:hypothetical protein